MTEIAGLKRPGIVSGVAIYFMFRAIVLIGFLGCGAPFLIDDLPRYRAQERRSAVVMRDMATGEERVIEPAGPSRSDGVTLPVGKTISSQHFKAVLFLYGVCSVAAMFYALVGVMLCRGRGGIRNVYAVVAPVLDFFTLAICVRLGGERFSAPASAFMAAVVYIVALIIIYSGDWGNWFAVQREIRRARPDRQPATAARIVGPALALGAFVTLGLTLLLAVSTRESALRLLIGLVATATAGWLLLIGIFRSVPEPRGTSAA